MPILKMIANKLMRPEPMKMLSSSSTPRVSMLALVALSLISCRAKMSLVDRCKRTI